MLVIAVKNSASFNEKITQFNKCMCVIKDVVNKAMCTLYVCINKALTQLRQF